MSFIRNNSSSPAEKDKYGWAVVHLGRQSWTRGSNFNQTQHLMSSNLLLSSYPLYRWPLRAAHSSWCTHTFHFLLWVPPSVLATRCQTLCWPLWGGKKTGGEDQVSVVWKHWGKLCSQSYECILHFCGSGLDLSVRHKSPVGSTIGPEHRLFALLINLHLEGLHVCLHILIGWNTHSWW